MTSDLGHSTSLYPVLMEAIFMSSSLAVILIDWNHSFLERSLLRLILSYLPRWRYRNIRQDVYLCLFAFALGVIYLKKLSFDLEVCRIIFVAVAVLLSFWLQSKTRVENVSDKCIETSKIQVSDKSVGESLVTRDQEVSASTCCWAGVSQLLLPLSSSSSSSSKPPPEMDIKKEMGKSYVEACKSQYDEKELVTALEYLNKLSGGIQEYRDAGKLSHALEHIKNMEARKNASGFFKEYSLEELHKILVEEKLCSADDLKEVVKDFLETYGYPPSPVEFIELYDEQKGIVQLKKDVKEKGQALESSQKKSMSLEQRLQQMDQQALQQHQRALQQHQRALQQKDQTIQDARLANQQMRQRMRELELGELQKRMCEMEKENQRLSQRLMCKICHVEEVQVLLSPCNHLVSCQECVPSLPKKECPICAKEIQDTIKMFFA